MQHLEGSDTPVLYIGRTVLEGLSSVTLFWVVSIFRGTKQSVNFDECS